MAMPPQKRDLLLARIGIILLIVGYLVVGLAETSSLMLIGKNKEPLCSKDTGPSLSTGSIIFIC